MAAAANQPSTCNGCHKKVTLIPIIKRDPGYWLNSWHISHSVSHEFIHPVVPYTRMMSSSTEQISPDPNRYPPSLKMHSLSFLDTGLWDFVRHQKVSYRPPTVKRFKVTHFRCKQFIESSAVALGLHRALYRQSRALKKVVWRCLYCLEFAVCTSEKCLFGMALTTKNRQPRGRLQQYMLGRSRYLSLVVSRGSSPHQTQFHNAVVSNFLLLLAIQILRDSYNPNCSQNSLKYVAIRLAAPTWDGWMCSWDWCCPDL